MTPIAERISEKLLKRLQRLAAHYTPTVPSPSVEWAMAHGHNELQHYGVIVASEGAVVDPALSAPGNPPSTAFVETFSVKCYVAPSELTRFPADWFRHRIHTAVRQVVTDPAANWHNWDGLAINTMFGSPEWVTDGGMDAVNVPVIITYRTSELDPAEVR